MDAKVRFDALFPDEESCIDYIRESRWPNGFRCPACGHSEAYGIGIRTMTLYECRRCKRQTSLKAGTIMHKSRTPLRKWLICMYIVACSDSGISAVALSELINVTYKTAWSMLYKVRRSISAMDEARKLTGHVEAKHEIFMKKFIPSSDQLKLEHSVVAAKETRNFVSGSSDGVYYKIKLLPRSKEARLPLKEKEAIAFKESHCAPDRCFLRLNPRMQWCSEVRYAHNMSGNPFIKSAERRRLASLLDNSLSLFAYKAFRWMNDTFHGIGIKYAQQYIDEYCFRRNAANQPSAFRDWLRFAVNGSSLSA